jgi:tetratricopeptide (TPR) repeat protein
MTKLQVVLVLTIFVAVVAGGANAAGLSVADDVSQAQAQLDKWSGQPDLLRDAKERIDRALRRDPKNYEALAELARYQIMSGYIREKWTKRRTTSVGEFVPGTLETAEATLKEALDIKPEFAKAYVLLGHVYTQQERVQDAAAALRKAEQIGTDDPWLDLNWADLHLQAGETAAAEERWRHVIEKGTTQPKARLAAYGYLTKSYVKAGKVQEATALYEQQIAENPTNAWLRSDFAIFLHCHGANDRAIEEHRGALKIMDFGIGRREYANALYAKWAGMILAGKNVAEAERYFKEAQANYPSLEDVMVYEGSTACGLPTARALHSKKNVSLDARVDDGSTALLVAVNKNDTVAVKSLLEMGANPNVADHNGWTPLLSAADEGNEENVRLLLARGADTHQTLRGRDAAMRAEQKGYPKLAQLIR